VRAKRAAEKTNRLPDSDATTVGEYLDYWREDVVRANVRPSSFGSYERVIRLHLKPHIGGHPLKSLDTRAVNRLWATLSKQGMSAGNVRKCSEVFASALEHAVREGMIAHAPTRSAVKPRVVKQPIEVFSDDEAVNLLAAASGDRLEALYMLAFATGARQGELLSLEAEDVDLEDGTIHIRRTLDERDGGFHLQPPKSAAGVRVVSLPEFALVALRRHMAGRGTGPLFATRGGNYFLRSNFIRKEWEPLCEAAGVPYRKFHSIRHTHASRLLAEGVDPAEVARRIGDSIETLMRSYAHWMRTGGRDTAAKVNSIYGKKGPRLATHTTEAIPQGGGKVADGDPTRHKSKAASGI